MTCRNLKRNIGPWILPSSLPSNSSRFINCMMCGLVGTWSWRFWTGDRGGAGGNAGERAGGHTDNTCY